MAELTAETIPGYTAGTWVIDGTHSQIGFTVRHLVSKVKGTFGEFSGTIVTTDNPLDTKVSVTIQVASVDTKVADRNGHLLSADFFDVENFPTATFESTAVRYEGEQLLVDGDLTIRGITKPVTLPVEFGGIAKNPYGQTVAGAETSVTIDREAFGLTWNTALETGGVLVGKDVSLFIEIEAALSE